jgi:hypothetical protein
MDDKIEKYYNFIVEKLIDDSNLRVAKNPSYIMVDIPTEAYNYNHYKDPSHYGGSGFECGRLDDAFEEWFQSGQPGTIDYEMDYLVRNYGIASDEETDVIMKRYEKCLKKKVAEFCKNR